jgi:hypothetical protein
MASGEMSQVEFADFLGNVFQQIRNHTTDGAICAAFIANSRQLVLNPN